MNYSKNFLFLSMLLCLFACRPEEDTSIDIGELPQAPEFEIEVLASNPNLVVYNITSDGFFDYVWDLPGGTPDKSTLSSDTVFYQRAGSYAITLHAAKEGGSGTSSNTKAITIEQDAEAMCEGLTSLLTGECMEQCWRLSPDPGSVIVGPQPFSSEWFNSPGLDPAQENDLWCFAFEGGSFTYLNGGETFSACQGFVADPNYQIPDGLTYQVLPSASSNSDLKIILADDFWMGIEDTGPEYEIISLTEEELILLTPIKPCDGTPSPGWFTLTFQKG